MIIRYPRQCLSIAALLLVWIAAFALFYPPLSHEDPYRADVLHAKEKPTSEHLLGRDVLGRDVAVRLAMALRTGLIIASCCALLRLLLTILATAVLHLFPGGVSEVLARVLDSVSTIPFFLLAMSILLFLGNTMFNLILVITLYGLPRQIRFFLSECRLLEDSDFIRYSRLIGTSRGYIFRKHYLRNLVPQMLSMALMTFSQSILMESSLSFLGYGIVQPAPGLGNLIGSGNDVLAMGVLAHEWVPASICVIVIVLAASAMAESMRVLYGEV